jgi:hypothetical protein
LESLTTEREKLMRNQKFIDAEVELGTTVFGVSFDEPATDEYQGEGFMYVENCDRFVDEMERGFGRASNQSQEEYDAEVKQIKDVHITEHIDAASLVKLADWLLVQAERIYGAPIDELREDK